MVCEQLRARVSDSRVVVNTVGLSDRSGTAKLNFCRDSSDLSTLHRNVTELYSASIYEVIPVGLITGDEYCRSCNISHIDFLKIDTEGHELSIIKGFGDMIERKCIDLIQFEYNKSAVGARVFLRDFYDVLFDDYEVGRLTPVGVDFQEYSYYHEAKESNYLAVRKARSEYVDLLAIAGEHSRGLSWS